jgi:hypothetical protein
MRKHLTDTVGQISAVGYNARRSLWDHLSYSQQMRCPKPGNLSGVMRTTAGVIMKGQETNDLLWSQGYWVPVPTLSHRRVVTRRPSSLQQQTSKFSAKGM